jgi:LmbE family N-acetylglucosaminyl deacetylase
MIREVNMTNALRLMCVLAHPDDESLGVGGTLARYAAEGVEIELVTATRGERGWSGPAEDNPGLAGLGQIRTAELLAAARVLGLKQVSFLDYIDGDLDQAAPVDVISKIVAHLRRFQPHVVLTFGPDGAYGHPDHIAISQFTTAAIVAAAHPAYLDQQHLPPHAVSKLYYLTVSETRAKEYITLFGDLGMDVDGVRRQGVAWIDWAITTWIDTASHWQKAWQAIECHRSQIPPELLAGMTEAQRQSLASVEMYYRVFSLVNGGRAMERDLFEGLRAGKAPVAKEEISHALNS